MSEKLARMTQSRDGWRRQAHYMEARYTELSHDLVRVKGVGRMKRIFVREAQRDCTGNPYIEGDPVPKWYELTGEL